MYSNCPYYYGNYYYGDQVGGSSVYDGGGGYDNPSPSYWLHDFGSVYMNGEIGSSVRPVGETGMPTMVYPPPVAILAPPQSGPHFPEPHGGINGVIMPQDLYGDPVEAVEHMDGADNKRSFNSHDVSGGQPMQQGHVPDLPIGDLRRMLLVQLEYYFSPENLAIDKYLVTQMDQDHYVLIATLATFNMVKKLTSDIDLVTDVLRESKNVQVHADGKRVRPISHRTVVILRGIPSSTSAEEIKNIFENENCPKCTGCEFAFNDSWYVSFESDDDAMQAHRYLREDVREFKGQPIMARIKSRPTTLLSQGVGMGVPTGMKNGYSQQGAMMQSYMTAAPPFVPNQQTGVTAPVSLYAPGQQVHQNVFPGVLPSNYTGFGPWPGYFEMNAAGLPMFSLNGLPQSSPGYGKAVPMNSRPRNLNPMRGVGPRRTMSSGSDTQVVVSSGNNNSNGLHQHQQQPYGSQPPRKNNGAPPAPLLGMAPQSLVSHPPPHNHSNHHHSAPHNSLQNSSNQPTNNGRHYSNSYSQNLPHVSENYHYNRPYRGGGDTRPRSSMSSRRGPPRRGDEEGSYDYNNAPASSSSNSNYRGNPSTRSVPAVAVSPQIPAQVAVTNQNHQIDLDLEGSAFPPLPGSANASSKNGDSPYEGRLSDVVKGVRCSENVKSMRIGGGSSTDKEEPNEIVVSAAEPGSSPSISSGSPPGEVVVSAASPQKEEGIDMSSHFKKEYREIGVGSADENNDIRSTQGRAGVVSALRQMADKSTRTDENLLNGDQQPTGGNSRNSQTQTQQQSQQTGAGNNNGGYRKSVTSQGGGSKSPIPGKRGVPPFQTVSMGVGPDVPYTSSSSSYASPSKSPRGASCSSTVKNQHQADNNRPSSALVGTGGGPASAHVSSSHSQLSAADKDAFPTPNFVKVPSPSSAKPFSGVTDHNPKEPVRCEDERKESGQGDGKKTEDCSTDEGGPVRLSYAQVAQSRKDAAHQPVPPSTSTSAVVTQPSSSPQQSHAQSLTHQEERKGRGSRDNKDTRAQSSRNPRGNGDRDRDRGEPRIYRNRGGPRSRVTSDASDTGSNSGGNGKPAAARGPRSPK